MVRNFRRPRLANTRDIIKAPLTITAPAANTGVVESVPFASLTTAAQAYNRTQADVAALQVKLTALIAALKVEA